MTYRCWTKKAPDEAFRSVERLALNAEGAPANSLTTDVLPSGAHGLPGREAFNLTRAPPPGGRGAIPRQPSAPGLTRGKMTKRLGPSTSVFGGRHGHRQHPGSQDPTLETGRPSRPGRSLRDRQSGQAAGEGGGAGGPRAATAGLPDR